MEAIQSASAHVVLFLEHIPQTVHKWLGNQLKLGGATAELAVSLVDEQLKTTVAFMNSHGLMHFDAHFGNILTDGTMLYFADFGLSLSSEFALTPAEMEFLKIHRNYDRQEAISELIFRIIRKLFNTDESEIVLREYLKGEHGEVTPFIAAIIKKYAPIALASNEFFLNLRSGSKLIPYPSNQFEALCTAID